ncbi:catalase 1 [Umbelopsis nana]
MTDFVNRLASAKDNLATAAATVPGSSKKDQILEKENRTQDQESGHFIATPTGVRIDHTDDTLKAGERGPTLMEDFHFRYTITQFDHERIPERVVHARGSGAHGYFELFESQADITKAGVLTDTSRKTPVFVRFSTVQGSRGSADTVRDVRGFAVKFYTDEGNWDIVGNNIPVFFIQDAIKFPDLVHSLKPEPHNEIPQGQTAHDNFWDFASLMPESTHMLMWILSDRAIPRSYRMMQGFGVNTYILINERGERRFVKFHWKPVLGTHSLVWDEAQKLAGQDPDFHRRDLWEAIESGNYPQWDFGLQVVDEKDEHSFDFDLLDCTKLIPEEQVPVRWIGRMTLDRNPDNFFAETEQVAFCTQHVVPGIGHSDDPMLQGRNFSYLDTQLNRFGGPNFNEVPINKPVCPFFNNLRDGFQRQRINKGKVNYWPNRYLNPRPATAEEGAYVHFPEKTEGLKARVRAPKFKEFYKQATMFWNSLSYVEKEHLVAAARFELGHVDDINIQTRMIEGFLNVDYDFAKQVADGLGIKIPDQSSSQNHGLKSPALSQQNTVFGSAATRKVAIIVADGYDSAQALGLRAALKAAGALTLIIGPRRGKIKSANQQETATEPEPSTPSEDEHGLHADFSLFTAKSTMFDAIVIPGGAQSVETLRQNGEAIQWINEAYKHSKTIGAFGDAVALLRSSSLPSIKISTDENVVSEHGVVTAGQFTSEKESESLVGSAIEAVKGLGKETTFSKAFIDAIGQHRHWNRDVSRIPA